MYYKTLDGCELFYQLHGDDAAPEKIIFIMGLLGDHQGWIHQVEYFKQRPEFQICVFDNRGVARSTATWNNSTFIMAQDTAELLAHLHWKKVHVVGVSMGGMIAQHVAHLIPDKIASLSLIVTHSGTFYRSAAPFHGTKLFLQTLTTKDLPKLLGIVLEMLYSPATLADPVRRQILYQYHENRRKTFIPHKLPGVVGQLLAVQRHHVSFEHLETIRHGGFGRLVIGVRDIDHLVKPDNSKYLHDVIGGDMVILPAGHGVIAERTPEVNHVLLSHFARHPCSNEHSKIQVPQLPEENQRNITFVKGDDDDEHQHQHHDHKHKHHHRHHRTTPCHHRGSCFTFNLFGFLQHMLILLVLWSVLSVVSSNPVQVSMFKLCGSGLALYRSTRCVWNGVYTQMHIRNKRKKHANWLDFPWATLIFMCLSVMFSLNYLLEYSDFLRGTFVSLTSKSS